MLVDSHQMIKNMIKVTFLSIDGLLPDWLVRWVKCYMRFFTVFKLHAPWEGD